MSFQNIETKRLEIVDAYVLPEVDGASGDVLQTDGSGNVTWTSASSGVGTNYLALNRTPGVTDTMDNTHTLTSDPLYLTYDTTAPVFSNGWTYASSTTASAFACPETGYYKVTIVQPYKQNTSAPVVTESTWYLSVSRTWPGTLLKEATDVASISLNYDTTTVVMQNCHVISKVIQMDASYNYRVGVYCNSGASIDTSVSIAYNSLGNLIFEFIGPVLPPT